MWLDKLAEQLYRDLCDVHAGLPGAGRSDRHARSVQLISDAFDAVLQRVQREIPMTHYESDDPTDDQ